MQIADPIEQRFIEQIKACIIGNLYGAKPIDEQAILEVYADLLEERGDFTRAEFLRLLRPLSKLLGALPILEHDLEILLTRVAKEQPFWLKAIGLEPLTRHDSCANNEYLFEGPNGTPRPKRDVSPNTRLRVNLLDAARFKRRGTREA